MNGLAFGWHEWLVLFSHFLSLSLLAVGGAIMLAPDMHRFLVDEHLWLSDPQFASSIALAQAAPGPNVLFIALLGWNIGMNNGGGVLAVLGLLVTMVGVLLPSTVLTYSASRWGHRNRNRRSVRAFKMAMAPIVIALLLATAWVLASAMQGDAKAIGRWLLTALTTVIVWRTRIHLLWLLGAGALLGVLGLV
ncbi:MAG: chromate transporter [Burkholderiaceae bacterium]